ncbi:MAG: site-2 protease family protein [Candidatus Woesearchaeota archaeon]
MIYKIYKIKRGFSSIEIKHLLLSWLIISVIFYNAFKIPIIYSLLTVGLGFLVHELSHRFVAKKQKLYAEYRADFLMLLVSFFISFAGIVFLAPGGVIILGNVTRKKNGIISLSGPLSNLVLAFLFLIIKTPLSEYGFMINTWLAFFNLLPFPGFDGSKVLAWNKVIYAITAFFALALVFISYL